MPWLPWRRSANSSVPDLVALARTVATEAAERAAARATEQHTAVRDELAELRVLFSTAQAQSAITATQISPADAAQSPGAFALDNPIWYTTPIPPKRPPGTTVSLDLLRQIADTYDILRSCIMHLQREVRAVPIEFVPADVDATSDEAKRRCREARALFDEEGPIGGMGRDRFDWEGQLVEDLCVVGAAALYLHPTRGGGLYEVRSIDAATIRPLVTPYGFPRGEDEPAFQQWILGVPVGDFTRAEMIYQGLYPRTWTPYYGSSVEYVIHAVNAAVRADQWNLTWLTDGNSVDEVLSCPADWKPEQVMAFQNRWDQLMSGDAFQRRRAKFVPHGVQQLRQPSRKENDFQEFMLWLLRRTCSIMGVQPAAIGYAGEQYKVSQDQAMAQTSHFGAGALLTFRERLYNKLLRRFGYADVQVRNVTGQEAERKARAERNEVLIRSGQRSPNECRLAEGEEPYAGGDVRLVPGTLVPVAKLSEAAAPVAKTPEPPGGKPSEGAVPAGGDGPDGGEELHRAETAETTLALRQWERKALHRLKQGKRAECPFATEALPAGVVARIGGELARCETAADVAELFRAEVEWITVHGRHIPLIHGTPTGSRPTRVSYEAVPSTKRPVLPGIHHATYDQKLEYTRDVMHVLQDGRGRNLLAKDLGLGVRSFSIGPGYWEGAVNPSVQFEVTAPRGASEKDARLRVRTFCAALGKISNQDGVAYHRPIRVNRLSQASGMLMNVGRILQPDEMLTLSAGLRQHLPSTHADVALVADPNGVRLLNFTGLPNEGFRDRVKQTFDSLPIGREVKAVHCFGVNGDVVSDYERSLGEYSTATAGSSDLRRRVDRYHHSVQELDQRYAERYGWGEPGRDHSRAEGAGNGAAGDGVGSLPDEDLPEEGAAYRAEMPAAAVRALRQWEQKALHRLQNGRRAACPFATEALPAAAIERIAGELARCETAADVAALFRAEIHWVTIHGHAVPIGAKVGETVSATPPARHSKVAFVGSGKQTAERLVGRPVTVTDIQEAIGAPSGATTQVSTRSNGNLSIATRHPLFRGTQHRTLARDADGRLVMYNDMMLLKKEHPKGMGTQILASQIAGARKLGVQEIVIACAARTKTMCGYYTWPRLGFNAPVPEGVRAKLPAHLRRAKDLIDLLSTEEGRREWERKGESIRCTFDLDPESKSSHAFRKYIRETGFQHRPL